MLQDISSSCKGYDIASGTKKGEESFD